MKNRGSLRSLQRIHSILAGETSLVFSFAIIISPHKILPILTKRIKRKGEENRLNRYMGVYLYG